MYFIKILFILCLPFYIIFLPLTAQSEAPPKYYEQNQARSDEQIKINILSYQCLNIDECYENILYTAEVIDIYRATSSLNINDKIEIKSWRLKESPSCIGGGPISPQLLDVGWTGTAYLNKINGSGNSYEIAAGKESFFAID